MKQIKYLFFLFISLFFSCTPEEMTGSNYEEIISKLPDKQIITLPTYDGSNQAVHPDILFFKDGFRGHFFYLSMTPYPFSNARLENPSVLVSENGIDYYEEKQGLNPLVAAPPYDHNDDPDLMFNDKTKTFHLYYLETLRPYSQNVILLRSKDGIYWDKQQILHFNLSAREDFILSPSVIKKESTFWMFFVNRSAKKNQIQYMTSADGIHWDKSLFTVIHADYPDELVPWHVDVFSDGQQYYLLCCGPYEDQNLYLAKSSDLKIWDFIREPIIRHSPDFFNSTKIYRSSGLVIGDYLFIWFSFENLNKEWQIGMIKYSLNNLAPRF